MFLSNTRFSSTSFNAELYILMEIRYRTDNPSNIRRILTVYHTHVTQDHKWIFTILYKVTKTDSVGNKIMCMKDKVCEAYNTIIDYFDKYGAEGGAVT